MHTKERVLGLEAGSNRLLECRPPGKQQSGPYYNVQVTTVNVIVWMSLIRADARLGSLSLKLGGWGLGGLRRACHVGGRMCLLLVVDGVLVVEEIGG